MSTIEKLAELAKGATQGPWSWGMDNDGLYGAGQYNAVLDYIPYEGMWLGTHKAKENAAFIAACNPAAIAQAHAEYQELARQGKELERRNAELAELLLEFISADSVACGHGYGIGDSDLIARCEAAVAHTSRSRETALPLEGKQEKADAAE